MSTRNFDETFSFTYEDKIGIPITPIKSNRKVKIIKRSIHETGKMEKEINDLLNVGWQLNSKMYMAIIDKTQYVFIQELIR